MAQVPRLVPAEFPEHIQKFLFACAFWIVAADEQLTQGEQRWLTEQFGPRKVGLWLEEMTAADGAQFYQAFDKLSAGLGDNDKRRIFPSLVAWLQDCGASDAAGGVQEKEIIEKIKVRLSLDAQVARIMQGYPKQTPPAAGQTGTRPPPVPVTAAPVKPARTEPRHEFTPTPQYKPAPAPGRVFEPEAVPEREHALVVSVPFRTFRGHRGAVVCACFDSRGATAFSGSEDRTLRAWDVSAGVETRTFVEQEATVSAVACSVDGVHLYSGSTDGVVTGWKSGSGGRLWQTVLETDDAITSIAVSGDSEIVVAARESGLMTVLKAEDGRTVKNIGERESSVHDLCMSNKGKLLLCAGENKIIRSWDGVSDTLITVPVAHQGPVLSIRMSRDGRVAASGSADKTVKLWDVQTGRELYSLAGHVSAVHGLDFSSDGHFVVSAAEDGTVKAWEVSSGRQVFTCRISTQPLWGVAFHPAGNSVIVCGADSNLYHLENLNMQL
ncbi:MAG: WD40 repeat domain-containing protein [bacterium]